MAICSDYLKKTQNTEDMYYSTPLKFKDLQRTALHKVDHESAHTPNNNHQYKLPINLFYTAAEYNKMLITNGRSVRKKIEPMMEGYITTLEFINQQIFQKNKKYKSQLKKDKKQSRYVLSTRKNNQSSYTKDCLCCCCDQYCQICKKQQSNKQKNKINKQHLQRLLSKVSQKNLKRKKNGKKIGYLDIPIYLNDKINKNNKNYKNLQENIDIQKYFNNIYIKNRNLNINNLIDKSLKKFENKKKQDELKKIYQNKKKINYKIFMKQFQQEVRLTNKLLNSVSKQKHSKKTKSESKNKIGFKYWQKVRNIITKSLSKQKISRIKSKQLNKTNQDIKYCNHRVDLQPYQIIYLSFKHQQEAKQKIAKKCREMLVKGLKIQKNLSQLERNRIKYINSCKKKKFQPTQQMIDEAFKKVDNQQQKCQKQINKNNSKLTKIKS